MACIFHSAGVDLIHQGWSRKGSNVSQQGYGSAAILHEQGMYLETSIYRPVIQVLMLFLIMSLNMRCTICAHQVLLLAFSDFLCSSVYREGCTNASQKVYPARVKHQNQFFFFFLLSAYAYGIDASGS